jgi:hypothetical protein
MNNERTCARFKRMFQCDQVRIPVYEKKMFLVLGYRRNTRQDSGVWMKNGEPVHYDYIRETVVASGFTVKELVKSAREYRRLMITSMEMNPGDKTGKTIDWKGLKLWATAL